MLELTGRPRGGNRDKLIEPIDVVEYGELRHLLFFLDRMARRLVEDLPVDMRFPPSFALRDDALDFIESAIGTGDATLDNIAPHFARPTAVAGLGRPPLDGPSACRKPGGGWLSLDLGLHSAR
jgi:hypothetical protein